MVTTGEAAQTKCRDCDTLITRTPIMYEGRELFSNCAAVCDTCSGKLVAAREEELRELRGESWTQICPPLYRNTDPEKLAIDPMIMREVLSWQVSPKGIGLVGESGRGKTRLLYLLLNKLYEAKHRVHATTAKRFENCCHRMFDKENEARDAIAECKSTSILFIDDIGKEKYTERVESEFYDLIETRTSYLRPILWTANYGGEQLTKMMGADRGTPIVRRLREFSTVFSV